VKFLAGSADTLDMRLPACSQDLHERALHALDQLPPFSPVLNRLIASLAREDVSFAEISLWIEKDTVMAGNVLRVVNSSLYGRRGTISSVRHAVAMMGQVKLRNTVLGLSVSQIWNRVRTPPGWPMTAFNCHSVATAILSDLLAQRCRVAYPEGGFAAGLFHDLGKLLIAVACGVEGDGIGHAELSAEALARWNIPIPVQEAVQFHHQPRTLDLSYIVHVADRYANTLGLAILPTVAPETVPPEAIFASVGIEEHQVPRIVEEFQSDFDLLQRFG
jgi:HD-like signal output (HDOD) protein